MPVWVVIVATLLLGLSPSFAQNSPPSDKPWIDEVSQEQLAELPQKYGNRTRSSDFRYLLKSIVDPWRRFAPYLGVFPDHVAFSFLPKTKAGLRKIWARVFFLTEDQEGIGSLMPTSPTYLPASFAQFSSPSSDLPLSGKTIVIDRGHRGGKTWGVSQDRRFHPKPEYPTRDGSHLLEQIQEGVLTWATGELFAQKLRKAGARVVGTRPRPTDEKFPYGKDPNFDLDRELAFWLGRLHTEGKHGEAFAHYDEPRWKDLLEKLKSDKFNSVQSAYSGDPKASQEMYDDLYEPFDLRIRAERANTVQPDAVVILHLNADKYRKVGINPAWKRGKQKSERSLWNQWTTANYIHGVVPGNIAGSDYVDSPLQQYLWAQQLLSGNLKPSIQLTGALVRATSKSTGVPTLYVPGRGRFPDFYAVDAWRGVYARPDLAVNKRIPYPTAYLELPMMNNKKEYELLVKHEIDVDGFMVSKRLEEYAEGLYQGTLAYFGVDTAQPHEELNNL